MSDIIVPFFFLKRHKCKGLSFNELQHHWIMPSLPTQAPLAAPLRYVAGSGNTDLREAHLVIKNSEVEWLSSSHQTKNVMTGVKKKGQFCIGSWLAFWHKYVMLVLENSEFVKKGHNGSTLTCPMAVLLPLPCSCTMATVTGGSLLQPGLSKRKMHLLLRKQSKMKLFWRVFLLLTFQVVKALLLGLKTLKLLLITKVVCWKAKIISRLSLVLIEDKWDRQI